MKRNHTSAHLGMRLTAAIFSIGSFVAFWQLAIHNPHPIQSASNQVATPDTYSLPVTSAPGLLPLPNAPHGSTGLSR